MPANSQKAEPSLTPRLGLWDTVSIIVGIVVGTAIFRSPTMVFQNAGGPWQALALWLLGGVLAWCGAVCYAELATTYPRDGGDYEYLKRAFGPWCAFLFGWAQLTTVVSGNIAIMAYAFADYALRIWPAWKAHTIWLVAAPVVALAVLNALGVIASKIVQNLLSAAKVIGLLGLVFAGLALGGDKPQAIIEANDMPAARIGLALVFVLYAYGGWSHAAYVAAEVRDQRRNLPRGLILGIACITLVYLAVNAAYLTALGFDGAAHADTRSRRDGAGLRSLGRPRDQCACDALRPGCDQRHDPDRHTGLCSLGRDYRALSWLAAWNRRSVAPVSAIAAQTAIALLLIALVGTAAGRNSFDAMLRVMGLGVMPWAEYSGGFESLVAGSTPVFWMLTLLTGISVFVLRVTDRASERPFKVPLYPLPALAFCGTCAYMLWASIAYARWLVLLGIVPLALGALLSFAMQTGRVEE